MTVKKCKKLTESLKKLKINCESYFSEKKKVEKDKA